MKRKLPVLALVTTVALLSISALGAELLEKGAPFPTLSAKDQHDKEYQFKPGTKAVLISFDMAAGKKANKYLANLGTEFLSENSVVYVSNIHGMPGIGRFFALPKMRKYPHRIVLADAEHLLDPFPQKQNHVTIILLDESAVVQSIAFWNPETDSLQDYLNIPP